MKILILSIPVFFTLVLGIEQDTQNRVYYFVRFYLRKDSSLRLACIAKTKFTFPKGLDMCSSSSRHSHLHFNYPHHFLLVPTYLSSSFCSSFCPLSFLILFCLGLSMKYTFIKISVNLLYFCNLSFLVFLFINLDSFCF